jgi:CRP-like cAMP-binding protein
VPREAALPRYLRSSCGDPRQLRCGRILTRAGGEAPTNGLFPSLPPHDYTLILEAPGFPRYLIPVPALLANEVREIANFEPGQKIIREGDAHNTLYVVVAGEVKSVRHKKAYAKHGPGEFFGEVSMIDKKPRFATVVASKRTRLIAFDRDGLFEMLNNSPRLAVKFLWPLCHVLNERLRGLTPSMLDQAAEAEDEAGDWA